jgi:catechol 2,3-dioxygenase-like lactoylglutathione lyase family enzyme
VSARINHIATNSNNPRHNGMLYELIFGMWYDEELSGPATGAVLRDGNVTLNLQARVPGFRGGLDHFGIAVDDIDDTFKKLKSDYPKIEWIDRPEKSPLPGYLSHDPAGSIFALCDASQDKSIVEGERQVPTNFNRWMDSDPRQRFVHHYTIRTKRIEECAKFYEDVFGFKHVVGKGDDPTHYLSDGRVTLMLLPWHITTYSPEGVGGLSVTGRGPDHIGFIVEDAKVVEKEVHETYSRFAPGLSPIWVLTTKNKHSDESQDMAQILDESCPMSSYQFLDKDGVFILIGDKTFDEVL